MQCNLKQVGTCFSLPCKNLNLHLGLVSKSLMINKRTVVAQVKLPQYHIASMASCKACSAQGTTCSRTIPYIFNSNCMCLTCSSNAYTSDYKAGKVTSTHACLGVEAYESLIPHTSPSYNICRLFLYQTVRNGVINYSVKCYAVCGAWLDTHF